MIKWTGLLRVAHSSSSRCVRVRHRIALLVSPRQFVRPYSDQQQAQTHQQASSQQQQQASSQQETSPPSSPPLSSSSQLEEGVLERAKQLWSLGKHYDAIRVLREQEHKSERVLEQLAQYSLVAGELAHAANIYAKLPYRKERHLHLSEALVSLGQFDKGEQVLLGIIKRQQAHQQQEAQAPPPSSSLPHSPPHSPPPSSSPHSPQTEDADALCALGALFLRKGKSKNNNSGDVKLCNLRAIQYLDRCIAANDKLVNAWFSRGIAKQRNGDHIGAVEDLTQTLVLDPSQMFAHLYRGDSCFIIGDVDLATADYDRVLTHLRDFVVTRRTDGHQIHAPEELLYELSIKLATCYIHSRDYDMVTMYLNTVLENDDPASAKFKAFATNRRGYVKFLKCDWSGAVKDHTIAINLDPNLMQAYRDRAEAYMALGLEAEAREDERMREFLQRKQVLK